MRLQLANPIVESDSREAASCSLSVTPCSNVAVKQQRHSSNGLCAVLVATERGPSFCLEKWELLKLRCNMV